MTTRNQETNDVYRCQHCSALNNAKLNEWCLCTGGEQTLICSRCHKCFCDAPTTWKLDFWLYASSELTERRREERRARGAFVPAEERPVHPVILVIDDDRLVHAIVSRVLSDFPGTLLHAFDGRAGLRMARQVLPELVITDVLLPLVDGRDISLALKSEPESAGVKVIVMTALYKGARYRNETLSEFRADDYIEKPVRAPQLRSIVSNALASAGVPYHQALAS